MRWASFLASVLYTCFSIVFHMFFHICGLSTEDNVCVDTENGHILFVMYPLGQRVTNILPNITGVHYVYLKIYTDWT